MEAASFNTKSEGSHYRFLKTAGMAGNISTYESFRTFRPKYRVDCKSVADIRSAVTEAASSGLHVRAMGAGLSWASHVATEDVCLVMSGVNRIHGIEKINKTILVDAGTRLGDISRALASHGLALPSLSFFPEVTIGGAISTGTHGTSHKWGILADFVRSLEIVLPTGEVKWLGPDSPPDELRAARMAVGMLGVIVRVELQAVNMPWAKYTELKFDLRDFLENRQSILNKYDHVWVHWTLDENSVRVECLEISAAPRKGFHRYVENRNGCWGPPSLRRTLLGPAWRLLRNVKHATPSAAGALAKAHLRQQSETDMWISMQYAVPLSELDAVAHAIKDSWFAVSNPDRIMEMKFLKSSELSFLGPNAGNDSVLFNAWWWVPRDLAPTILQPFEEIMRGFHARPHWGKFHTPPDLSYMQLAYPQWDRFESVRHEFDPAGIFNIIHPADPEANAKKPN